MSIPRAQKVVNHNDDDDYDDDNNHWITTSHSMNLDWLESVQLVFDYFCERTPRSFVETRETSLVRAMWSIQRRIRWSSVLQSCQLLVLFTYRLEPTREHRTLSPMLMLW